MLSELIEKRKNMYIYQCFFFFFSMYTYGIATYFIPIFLFFLVINLLILKKINLKDIAISSIIYIILFMPLIFFYIINILKLGTIRIGMVTIPYMSEFKRTSDILLFTENSIMIQLVKNILKTLQIIFLQHDIQIWNSIPLFGTLYIISNFFIIFGIYNYISKKEYKANKQLNVILIWTILALMIGIFIEGVNVYKINIIWYPFIILTAFGIYIFCEILKEKIKKIYIILIILYIILTILFLIIFNHFYKEKIENEIFFDAGLVEILKYIEGNNNNDVLILSYNNYNYYERIKNYIRFATEYDINDYNYDNLYDTQFTSKYKIMSIEKILNPEIENHSSIVVQNAEVVEKYLNKKDYKKIIKSGNYALYEKVEKNEKYK